MQLVCIYQLSSFQLESLSTNGFHMLRANTVALIRTTILRWQAVIPICQAKVLVGCNLLRQLLVHLVACMATVTTSNSNHTNMARLCICSCQWGLLTSRVTGDPAWDCHAELDCWALVRQNKFPVDQPRTFVVIWDVFGFFGKTCTFWSYTFRNSSAKMPLVPTFSRLLVMFSSLQPLSPHGGCKRNW